MELTALSREQQDFSRRVVIAAIALLVMFYLGWQLADSRYAAIPAVHQILSHASHSAHDSQHSPETSEAPAVYSVLPFVVLLLAVAVLPLFHRTGEWWEKNWNRLLVAAGLGGLTLAYYVFLFGNGVTDHTTHELSQPGWPAAVVVLKNAIVVEYIPFIVLLFSLYVISGGVSLEGNLVGRPKLNAGIIAVGAGLASFIGTTGAAMLLIRPLLKANAKRKYVAHTVIFFVFVVCNTGGCLLPIGDPPLFLGYLRGVDFFWTMKLWPMWLGMNAALIAIYFVWDWIRFRQEAPSIVAQPKTPQKLNLVVQGYINFVWLAGIIGCVILLDPSKPFPGTHWHAPQFYREISMLGFTALSLWSTSPEIRRKNAFNYDAILEVAALFIGIFICMQAPIQLLNKYGASLGFDTPAEFYWGTGVLSSFLDNAPTYVVFFETAKTLESNGSTVAGVAEPLLAAISLGAVFMGAMTYIGNGPNFMVKAIAEKNNVKMPSFFGYMAYSCAVLLPLSALLTWLSL